MGAGLCVHADDDRTLRVRGAVRFERPLLPEVHDRRAGRQRGDGEPLVDAALNAAPTAGGGPRGALHVDDPRIVHVREPLVAGTPETGQRQGCRLADVQRD